MSAVKAFRSLNTLIASFGIACRVLLIRSFLPAWDMFFDCQPLTLFHILSLSPSNSSFLDFPFSIESPKYFWNLGVSFIPKTSLTVARTCVETFLENNTSGLAFLIDCPEALFYYWRMERAVLASSTFAFQKTSVLSAKRRWLMLRPRLLALILVIVSSSMFLLMSRDRPCAIINR